MKIHLALTLECSEDFKTKYQKAFDECPSVGSDIMRTICNILSLSFHINKEDNINLIYFDMGEVIEENNAPIETVIPTVEVPLSNQEEVNDGSR